MKKLETDIENSFRGLIDTRGLHVHEERFSDDDLSQLATHFDVFENNVAKRQFQYEISHKGVGWIGLLPFWWINLFTTQYREAFEANTYRFINDATRDGTL